jgi:serine/threonine protein kinase
VAQNDETSTASSAQAEQAEQAEQDAQRDEISAALEGAGEATAELPDLDDPRYELCEQVGEGAMAVVYRARARANGAPLAIKLMQKQSARKLESVQRLAQEVSILVELSHPCIVQVYSTGVAADGAPYVAMEWVEGPTLRHRLNREARPPLAETLVIVEQIAAALCAAHRASIVHRDLKPENVMLRPDGAVKVLDFGMAKVLRHGAPILTAGLKIFGTPQYMSPERARGKMVSAAADVYALGAICYEMVCGRRPFDGETPMEVLVKQCNEPPPPLEDDVPAPLAELVLTTLAKHPDDRPSAGELIHALRAAANEL